MDFPSLDPCASIFQYFCCFNYNDAECTPHILTHFIGGDVSMLREDLTKFVNGNVHWINEVCGETLTNRGICLDSFLNDIVEPGFLFDDVAIMVVAMMSGMHTFILCKDRYWTIRSNNQYEDCPIHLAFFGDGVFKQVCPIHNGASEFMGTSTETLLDKQLQTVLETYEEAMVTSENPNVPNNGTNLSDIDVNLQDTGILPDIGKESEQQETMDLDSHNTMQDPMQDPTLSQNNEEHSEIENIQQSEDRMDTAPNNQVGVDVSDDKEDEVNMDIDLNETAQKETKDKHSRKLIVLLDKYSNVDVDIQNDEMKKKMEKTEYTETEEDSEDASGNDSGIEMDGWEPDAVRKKKDRWAKKQTKTIATDDGSLSVHSW